MYVNFLDADTMRSNLEENDMTRDEMAKKQFGHKHAFEVSYPSLLL